VVQSCELMAETFAAGSFKTHCWVEWVVVYNFSSVATVEYVILRVKTNGTCNYMNNRCLETLLINFTVLKL